MMQQGQKKIAMWSGPRNLSTAMMYSFAQRTDTTVVDEPFYAAYLQATAIIHPMREEIIASGETNPELVTQFCTGNIPANKTVFYQKHMTKHMIPAFDRNWIHELCNVFLIRDPARVIASYHAKHEDPQLADIGVKEQLELFDAVCQKTGYAPIVIDSSDILSAPETMIMVLCSAIGIEFQPAMLHWPTGARAFDGIWAPHWYQSVWRSSGFGNAEQAKPEVPSHLRGLLDIANSYYERIKVHAIGLTFQ